MKSTKLQFPLIDAFLLTPKEGKKGVVGVCTNATAPGQVLNDIEDKLRKNISVLGPLIGNRDGSERMVVNSLVHPTMRYLILFSEETLSFSASTNLLLAVCHGIDSKKSNKIVKGVAASSHYPNLSKKIVDTFRKEIIVLPLFMYKNGYSERIINQYLKWLKPKINNEIYSFLKDVNSRKKIYYDSLNQLVNLVASVPVKEKKTVNLNPKDFQHLQPPKISIKDKKTKPKVPFYVSIDGKNIRLDIQIKNKTFFIKSKDLFLMEYSLMKFLGRNKNVLSYLEQLFLGAELSRIDVELKNNIRFPSFVKSSKIKGKTEILLEPKVVLIPDKEYYYRVSTKNNLISVVCLAFDVCRDVFELQSIGLTGILEYLVEKNRFEKYEMDILHRMDVGGQAGSAAVAASRGYSFIQDFPYLFEVNTKNFPLSIVESDNFIDLHKKLLLNIYTAGVTEEHGDKHKGLTRTNVSLAVYRNSKKALKKTPVIYKQGDLEIKKMRELYRKQILRFDNDGSYNYGHRTRSYFGFDQLQEAANALIKSYNKAAMIQRFHPSRDMGSWVEEETGKMKYTHDPCLTHDIFFVKNKKLHSFHIARVQNAVNAYPENIFGLYDAYVTTISQKTGLDIGDMYMFSSRANILLLTEEQRTKKILAEPSKSVEEIGSLSGPYELGRNIKNPGSAGGVAYIKTKLKKTQNKPRSNIIKCLENFEGVNIIERAIDYLKKKGENHNNPILTQYQPGKMDIQGDYLVFFQANVFAGKVQANAVFVNHSINNINKDKKILSYLATQYGEELKYPLGDLNIFYVAYIK